MKYLGFHNSINSLSEISIFHSNLPGNCLEISFTPMLKDALKSRFLKVRTDLFYAETHLNWLIVYFCQAQLDSPLTLMHRFDIEISWDHEMHFINGIQ